MVNSENGNKRERKRGSKKKGSPSQQSNTNTMQTPEPTTTTNTHIPQPSSSRGVTSANMGSGEAAPRTSFDSERHTPAPSSTHYSSSEEAEDGSQNGGADRSRRTHSPAYHPYAGASSSRGRPWTANMNPEPIARFGESGFQFIQQGPQPGASESRPRSGSDSRYTSSRPQEDDRDRRKPAQQNGAQPFSRHASDGHDIRRRDSPPPAHTRERSRDMNADQHSHARGHSQSTSASPQNRPRSPPSDEDRTARPRPVQRIGSGTGSSYIPRKPPSSKFGPWAVNTARGIPPGDPRHPSNQGPPQRAPITDTRPREDVKGKGRAIESDDDDDQD
ncbi:hypothetical protein SISSUDRAFT_1091179 [Sistotremastrum suecicum HHB10207 ss-3]|uniref:Uncharacterized protein n=1 Tax=Sistotremastrum suecicum HHB10207 ss-3 TaxID=1314776 RepID=A0A166FAW5_9AGAM|nr:hypothetical protein SISSUDRAFT_1091179 [Sistotremastrum suecicum HHB10207 ss-3]